MKLSDTNSARIMRDAGIDAMAVLDSAVCDAIEGVPAEEQKAIMLAFGQAMGCVMIELINPATAAFPEPDPDDATWAAVVKARVAGRAGG